MTKIASRHGRSCDFAQDDTWFARAAAASHAHATRFARHVAARSAQALSRAVILRAVAGSTVARRNLGRLAQITPHDVILRAVAGSTAANTVTRSAA